MDGNLTPIIVDQAAHVSLPLRAAVGATLSEVWQRVVGDTVVKWRIANASKISQQLEGELSKRGLTLRMDALPTSYAFRWFDAASKEDIPEIQALFAKLLANAANGNVDALDRQNIELVSQMTPRSAALFELVCRTYREHVDKAGSRDPRDFRVIDSFSMRLNHFKNEFDTAFDTLVRLALLRRKDFVSVDPDAISYQEDEAAGMRSIDTDRFVRTGTRVAITPLAISLMDAIYPKATAVDKI